MRTHKLQCLDCHRVFDDEENIEAIRDWGYCTSCDAAKGEAAENHTADMAG